MKRVSKVLLAAALASATCLGLNTVSAQDNTDQNTGTTSSTSSSNSSDSNANSDRSSRRSRFNGDPSQWRQARLDGYRDRFEIKDDAEWGAIKPLIEKVMDAQQQVFSDRVRGMMGGFGGGGGGSRGGDNNTGDRSSRRGGGLGGFGEPSKEAEDLQKAVESKAPNSELKAALAKFNQAHKDKQTALETSQANLRKVLSVRQEAIASLAGLL